MNSDCKNSTKGASLRREGIALIGLLLLICVLIWPGMRIPLVMDDLDHVAYVSKFSSWRDCLGADAYSLFRPVKNFVYYGLRDIPIFQWHAINLSVYLAAVVSVYLLMRRLLGSAGWAFCLALLWSTSPTQVSTAVWMAAVNISLAVVLTCACLFFHDLSRQNPHQSSSRAAGLIALSVIFLFFAEISYETAICVPGLCILVDALRKRAVFSREALIRYTALGLVTLVYLAIRSYFGSTYSLQTRNSAFAPDIQSWQLVLSAPWFLWKHFSMWLMPLGHLEFLSSYLWGVSASPLELASAWAFLVLLIGVIFLSWKRAPWIALGLLWFLVSSFPSSNFIPIRSGPIADYYLVFPGIGLAMALAGFFRTLLGWIRPNPLKPQSSRPLLGGALLCLIGFWRILCIPMFWLQTSLWNRPLDLYLSVDLTRSAQFHAQSLASRELYNSGRISEAKALAQKSFALAPWDPFCRLTLGLVALSAADFDEAEARFSEVTRMDSISLSFTDFARFHLGKTFMAQDSKRHLVKETLLPLLVNQDSPSHMAAIFLQIECYQKQNQLRDALRAANKAVQLHPENLDLAALLKRIEKQITESPASTQSTDRLNPPVSTPEQSKQ